MAADPTVVTKIYEQIPLEAMQQVSDSYMAWYVDRVTRQLDDTMASLRAELRENDQKEMSYRPSPQELEAIERLQRSGVTGVDLLDRLVEQGDDWLSVTMRRLDHFERTGMAPKDYSTWCEHALSGAYDWIDHDRLAAAPTTSATTSATPSSGRAAPAPAPASRNAAPANQQASSAGAVPDWLARNNAPRNAAPSATPTAAARDVPTAPVPSVPRASDSTQPSAYSPAGQAQNDDDMDENGRRNIFRIFTN
jgi:hypothetical protein